MRHRERSQAVKQRKMSFWTYSMNKQQFAKKHITQGTLHCKRGTTKVDWLTAAECSAVKPRMEED